MHFEGFQSEFWPENRKLFLDTFLRSCRRTLRWRKLDDVTYLFRYRGGARWLNLAAYIHLPVVKKLTQAAYRILNWLITLLRRQHTNYVNGV